MRTIYCVLILAAIYGSLDAYKLNVPRVLLPYHPKIQVQFPLEVTSGCFQWRSTRPDIVSVEAVNPDPSGCSHKAIVTSKTKHEEEQAAVIFAENKEAGVSLSCGVTVDVINSIAITTTAKTLFVDAAPAQMIVEAFNKEGDRFSSIGDIPLDWFFDSHDAIRPLRIVSFAQSKYDAPPEIQKLENDKLRGFVVLCEGVHTGSALLTAKFTESHFANIAPSTIDLMVIANVMLKPPEDLYVPKMSVIQYGAVLIKQNSVEDIAFPSKQYKLSISDSLVCEIDEKSTKVTALTLGDTEIVLNDLNMKIKGLKPQSARIYVVDPDVIQFTIDKGGYWYLQKGVDYRVSVRLIDTLGNNMFIPDNAKFETVIPSDLFDVLEASKNNVHFHVRAKATGHARLRSSFISMTDKDGKVHSLVTRITGDQEVHVSDVIEIKPYLLVFPYQPKHPYYYQLHATGGTGNYKWQSDVLQIATIDESKGLLKTAEIGHTVVRVEDVYNPHHFALAQVYVLEVADVKWGESHLEAELGSDLILNVRGLGLDSKTRKLMPFTDCRSLDLRYEIADQKVFWLNSNVQSEIPVLGRGCATVSLKALSNSDTKAKVRFDRFADEQTVSAFPPLEVSVKNELLLTPGSEMKFTFKGGPRPWILDPSHHFTDSTPQVKEFVSIIAKTEYYVLKCGPRTAQTDVLVNVGNKKSSTNTLPVVARAKLQICCSVPDRLLLGTKPLETNDNLPKCPSFVHSIYYGSPAKLQLLGYGRCLNAKSVEERQFDSLTGVKPSYQVDQEKLITVAHSKVQPQVEKLFSDALPKSVSGIVKVTVFANIASSQLSTTLSLNLVGMPEAIPPYLLLWNAKNIQGSSVIVGGSGHFWIDPKSATDYVKAHLIANEKEAVTQIKLTPLKQGHTELLVHDLCISGAKLPVDVWVSDITKVKIVGSDLVQLNSQVPLEIEVYGTEDKLFSPDIVNLMTLDVAIQHDAGKLRENDLLKYSVLGVSVGTSVVTASVRSATGKLIKASHQIQVFAPLKLLPEVVTLVPESVFQFEIIGGPQPLSNVEFKLNRTNVASVAENGLITSFKGTGETTVTALVTADGGRRIIAQDTAIVRVVSLVGIKIAVSSAKVDKGETFTARIEGLDDRENPFAFGGAEYPFEVNWSVDSENILETSPVNPVREESLNKFAARFLALKSGHSIVTANLIVHPLSSRHFTTRRAEFVATVDVVVQDKLGLLLPEIGLNSVLLTPDTRFELKSNRNQKEVTYILSDLSNTVVVAGRTTNQIMSGPNEGSVPLKIVHFGSAYNESAFVTVDVMNPDSVELVFDLAGVELPVEEVTFLPLGSTIKLKVVMKDHRGRVFSAFNNELKFRPHRFDLTDIVAANGNKEFIIHLKHKGETVFSVWDAANPRLNTFIRLPVGEIVPLPDEAVEETVVEKQVCEAVTDTARIDDSNEFKWRENKIIQNGLPMLISVILLAASVYIFYYSYQLRNDSHNMTMNKSQSFHTNGLKPVSSSTPNNFFSTEPTIASRFPRKAPKVENSFDDSFNKSSSFSNANDSLILNTRANRLSNQYYGN